MHDIIIYDRVEYLCFVDNESTFKILNDRGEPAIFNKIKYLEFHENNLNCVDNKGNTILHKAIEHCEHEIITHIINIMSDIDMERKRNDGKTVRNVYKL